MPSHTSTKLVGIEVNKNMSNKKRRIKERQSAEIVRLGLNDSESHHLIPNDAMTPSDANQSDESRKSGAFAYLKRHLWVTAVVALVALGAMGAGLKYLEESAKREKAAGNNPLIANKEQSFWSRLNPFSANPIKPTVAANTPTLSKEYVYAGSRILTVEDEGATATPTPTPSSPTPTPSPSPTPTATPLPPPNPPTDLAIWRPSDGNWWVMGGTNTQQVVYGYGMQGDIPVPGDYDGDGKTDFAIWRPSNANWYITHSSQADAQAAQFPFGQTGDKPVVADYDGDKKTDVAVYRPSNGTWYIKQSSAPLMAKIVQTSTGNTTDQPVPADFNGDGKADLAFRRDSNATFFYVSSTNNQWYTQAFGQPGDQPVCADYDGDGKADYAIRRGTAWEILQSSTNQIISYPSWGNTAYDTAVQNDYDGDGKVDPAVWRAAESSLGAGDVGRWYILQSSGGQRVVPWGQTGDIPVPAYYRR